MKNYVKEYRGYDVPEGATHYIDAANLLFYRKNIRKDWVYFSESLTGWTYANISKLSLDARATELPEAVKDAEWEPVVGEECNHIYSAGSDATKVFIVGIDKKGNYVFQGDGSDCYYSDPIHFFVPLKSAKDLEREAFFAAVRKAFTGIDVINLADITSTLFNADFTAPTDSE
tara:strand:+ start:396 stop:914 length:519 start_codon:yes stop_codon:yes gene_type:complete